MFAWFESFSAIEQLFLGCAILGGVMLVIRLLLAVAGLDHLDGDIDAPHTGSDSGFQFLTIQGISSFLTMFGLVGFTLLRNTTLGALVALIGAVAAGIGSVWIMQRIFLSMLRLQSSGTVTLDKAIGCEGTVYTTTNGTGGRVQITIANRYREFEAISADGSELPTGTAIRVTSVVADKLAIQRIRS